MECERLTKLIKNWYIQVKDEALAPARMADFMRSHLASCPVCLDDPVAESEVKKIIAIILPAAKVPKTGSPEEEPYFGEEDASSEQGGDEKDEEESQPEEDLDEEDEDIDELEDEDDDF